MDYIVESIKIMAAFSSFSSYSFCYLTEYLTVSEAVVFAIVSHTIIATNTIYTWKNKKNQL